MAMNKKEQEYVASLEWKVKTLQKELAYFKENTDKSNIWVESFIGEPKYIPADFYTVKFALGSDQSRVISANIQTTYHGVSYLNVNSLMLGLSIMPSASNAIRIEVK